MAADTPIITTGSADFSQGVDSLKTPTQQGPENPNGLSANMLAWMINATVRDGSISPRDGWVYRGITVGLSSLPGLLGSIFQGKTPYLPVSGSPYEIHVVGGHILKVDPTGVLPPIDLSAVFNLAFPAPLAPKAYFVQAGPYLVIQAGDYNPATKNGTLPLFWDGSTLSQSNGITGIILRGLTGPTTYSMTNESFFTVSNVGALTQLLVDAYPGNLYDKIHLYIASGTASGTDLGTYNVLISSGGNVDLVTLTTAVAGTTYDTTQCVSFKAVLEVGAAPVAYNSATGVGTGATQALTIGPTNNAAVLLRVVYE